MDTSRSLESVSRLLEILITSADGELRDRVLLEAAVSSGSATTAALWRPYRLAKAQDGVQEEPVSWMPQLAIGQVESLPDDALVRGVLEGGLDPEVRSDARILTGGAGGHRLSLVLGGVRSAEDLERVEALLFAMSLIDASSAPRNAADAFLASVPSALPADEDSRELRRLGHDLRNLLAGAMATKELLDVFGHELTSEQFEDADRVLDRECRRVGTLFSDALGGERVTGGCCSMANALQTLADVAGAQAEFADTQGVRIDVDVSKTENESLLALPEEALGRLAVNLLANAREAVLNGGARERRVRLEAFPCRTDAGLMLVVEDEGPGLPSFALDELLAEGFTHGKAGGSGLGLSVVSRLLADCGGTMRARNRPTGGARFEVSIPSVPAE